MATPKEILEMGKELGYTGTTLQEYVKREVDYARDERIRVRDHEIELKEKEKELKEKEEKEKERLHEIRVKRTRERNVRNAAKTS